MPDTFQPSTKRTSSPTSFAGLGFTFIPLRRAHLEFFGYVFATDPPDYERCIGNTMVDRDYLPLGFCLAWVRENGTVTAHAYFGEWLKTYPKDILRGMKGTMDKLRELGLTDIWAVADERVPESEKLVAWFRGVETDQVVEGQGKYWRIDLTRSPI